MGSKGTQTTTQTGQTYSANPLTQGAAGQAISGAESASALPFQMPVAPIAGFNPTQQQAFNQYQQLQGTAQPYYNQAAAFTNQSAAPITASDVNQYYNPMASNVTAQLQNIFGQQNVQNQGNLTQQAGGVGADRIAVGMGELANQQSLAAGQTYAGLYQQALQQAQQQKQLAAGAGQAFAGYGTGAQNAAIQGTGVLNQSGNQQQQQTQAELNAPYQNELARIAYQFQTPQYLAGITGGLSGALGGTTTGNQVTTPPYPTLGAQIAGIGTAGAGLVGAFGGFGGSGQVTNSDLGTAQAPLPGLTATDYQGYGTGGNQTNPFAARGGKVKRYDEGGATDQPLPFPGTSLPKMGGAEPIPYISMPMSAGHSGPLTGAINTAPPQQQSNSGNSIGSDISAALGVAKAVAPFFLKRGGAAYPHYGDNGTPGGAVYGPDETGESPFINAITKNINDFGTAKPPSNNTYAPPTTWKSPPVAPSQPTTTTDQSVPYGPLPPYGPPTPPSYGTAAPEKLERMEKKGKRTATAAPAAEAPSGFTPPYPDSLNRDIGQTMTRSPWMALVNAGAAMMTTPGNLGTSIGKGLQAGVGALDSQRKELRSEQELNDKAQQLYQQAQVHLDKYNKMTPYERASIGVENRRLDQGEGTDGGTIKPMTAYQRANEYRKAVELGQSLSWSQTQIDQEFQRRLERAHGHAGNAGNAGITIGTPKEFDDGKGGKVTGYWNGSTYAPKAP